MKVDTFIKGKIKFTAEPTIGLNKGIGKDLGENVTDSFIFGLFTKLKFLKQRNKKDVTLCFQSDGGSAQTEVL